VGKVIAFKPKTGPPPPVAAPAPKRSLWDVWSNPAAGQVSRKGNPFVRITNFTMGREYCGTVGAARTDGGRGASRGGF
jgi:hypothetical protein